MLYLLTALILLLPQQAAQVPPAPEVDPAIQAVVDRFFETQRAEDVPAYLALWSAKAKRPRPDQLKFIFDSGDDKFIDVTVIRAVVSGDAARLRVSATRVRTDLRFKNPDGSPRILTTPLQLALSLTREADGWKIVREGAPADELAAALIETDAVDARKAVLASEPDLVNVRLVEAIARRADALAQAEQFKQAQAIYERGLEIAQVIGDRRAEGQALQNIANSRYFQRDFPGALALYRRRLAIEREIANDEGIANALLGIGTIQYATYEYGAALDSYREALALQERLNDSVLVSTTLISTGNVLYLQGDYEAAIADYRRAEALKRKHFDLSGAATALEGLGRVYSAQGDYAAALTAFNGVLEERRKRNDIARQAFVLQGIGEIHFRLGNTDQARASFDESRKHFESVKDIGSAGRVLQGAALNELVIARFPVAEKAYTESMSLCTTAADDECIARAQVGLAFALAAQERYSEAIKWYQKSILAFNALNMEDAAARSRIGLAEALSGNGDHAGALEEAIGARRTGAAHASDDLLWRALVSQARAERKLGRLTEAFGTAKAALLAVRRMSAAALDRPGQAVTHDATAAFATVALLQAETGDPAGAFLTAEQMRVHALRSALAANERDIARGMTDSERAEERRLASELTTLHVRRDRQKDLPKPDSTALEKLDAAIKEATGVRAAWREKLFARLPELRIWRGLGPAATIDDLPGLLGPGDLLLQFIVDEHAIIVITAGLAAAGSPTPVEITAHAVDIKRQELADRIARTLDAKALASVAAWRKAGVELFGLLPSAVVDRLTEAKSIVIVPDDVLWRVPFEAMPIGAEYLADRAGVTYATSVTSAVRVPPAPAAEPKAPIVAIHSPALPGALLETLKTTAPSWVIRPPEAASAEIDRIEKASPDPAPIVLSGADATRDSLLRGDTRRPDVRTAAELAVETPTVRGVLHIAAPFRVNSAGPLFSPILLAPGIDEGATQRTESEFEIRELFNTDPLASTVMFSDPAALSKRDAAASAGPIAWAWRATGATTVIMRRWGGDDVPAADVIGRFYEELRAGKSAAEALDAARATVRRTEGWAAPAAWAGWLILTGG